MERCSVKAQGNYERHINWWIPVKNSGMVLSTIWLLKCCAHRWVSNLTGKSFGLLQRMKDMMNENFPGRKVFFLYCIIHQEGLSRTVLYTNPVISTDVKLVPISYECESWEIDYIPARRCRCSTVVWHNSIVRELTFCIVFKVVWDVQEEVQMFLVNWCCMFCCYIVGHLKNLKIILQGTHLLIIECIRQFMLLRQIFLISSIK
jgi:hypothetical protein